MDWFLFSKGPMYYNEKEKAREIEELKKQLEIEREKQLEKESGKEKEKAAVRAAGDMKPEIKELLEHMESVPLLYYEILAYFQRFKVENKALVESSLHTAVEK